MSAEIDISRDRPGRYTVKMDGRVVAHINRQSGGLWLRWEVVFTDRHPFERLTLGEAKESTREMLRQWEIEAETLRQIEEARR